MSVEFNEVQLKSIYEQLNQHEVRKKKGLNNFTYQQFIVQVKQLISDGAFTVEQVNNNQFNSDILYQQLLSTYPELKYTDASHKPEMAKKGGGLFTFFVLFVIAAAVAGYFFWDKIKPFVDELTTK